LACKKLYLENLSLIQKHFVKAMNICLKEGVMETVGKNLVRLDP
jgi:hypothetical protein